MPELLVNKLLLLLLVIKHGFIQMRFVIFDFFCFFFMSNKHYLRILTGKKHRQIKLQRLEKVRIWAFGLLVHKVNYL